jgi:hypothetical protein
MTEKLNIPELRRLHATYHGAHILHPEHPKYEMYRNAMAALLDAAEERDVLTEKLTKAEDECRNALNLMSRAEWCTARATKRAEAAEAKLAALVVALSAIAAPTYGTELSDTDAERASIYWQHLARFQKIAREAIAAAKEAP